MSHDPTQHRGAGHGVNRRVADCGQTPVKRREQYRTSHFEVSDPAPASLQHHHIRIDNQQAADALPRDDRLRQRSNATSELDRIA